MMAPEYLEQTHVDWATERQISRTYIHPCKPVQNGSIERFNHTAKHEWLDMYLFGLAENAQPLVTACLRTYDNERPNKAIGGIPKRQLLVAA